MHSHRTREPRQADIRTSHLVPAGNPQSETSDLRLPEAASPRPSSEGCSDWLGATRTGRGRSRFGLMRYRSATVADSHGLPCCCRVMSKERVTESRKLRMNSVSTVLCQVTNRAAEVSGRAQKRDKNCPGIPLRRIRVQGAVRSLRGVRHPILVVDLEGKSRLARSAELRLRTCGGAGVRMA